MNRIEDILKTISAWVNDIKKGLADDIRKRSVNLQCQMRLGWIEDLYEPTLKEERCKLGDCLAREGAAKPIAEYIGLLTANGRKDPNPGSQDAKVLQTLKSICWNYSDSSLDFCYELGKAGLFGTLVTHLDRRKAMLETTVEKDDFSILASLSTLHNCAKEFRNRNFFKQAKVVEALIPYTKTTNRNLIMTKMFAILAVAYLVDEDSQNQIAVDKPMLYIIVYFLQQAVEASDHRFNGFSVRELVDGLKHLANNDQNKGPILDTGILPLLENLLQKGDAEEKMVAAGTVWSLCFGNENKQKILQNRNIVQCLEKLGKLPGELGHVSSGALWSLKDNGAAVQKTRSAARSQLASKQIMISYSSRQKILALKVKARLQKLKCSVWMDMDGMESSNFKGTLEAIDNAVAFILCVSHDYKTQPSCRLEAEYAQKKKIPMYPILAELDYNGSGWLRELQGCKTCIDFSDPATFDNSFLKLTSEIQRELGASVSKSEPVQAAAPPSQSPPPIEQWTSSQVMNWASKNNLAQKHFQEVDGESLAYLRDMKKSSPEFYHKYVVEQLEISDLQDLKNLSRGLENLKF